jgi:hypothetical protein
MIKKTHFKIEKIDLVQGLCTVRHINPYGPVLSDEITEEELNKNGNPNHDIISTFDIPMQNYEFITADHLLQYIAKCYPSKLFEDYLIKKIADRPDSLQALEGQTFEKDVEEPEEIPVGQLMMIQVEPGYNVDTI